MADPIVVAMPVPPAPSILLVGASAPAAALLVTPVATPATVRVEEGPIGPAGPPGRDATVTPVASPIAAEAIRAGQPVTLDRTTGRAHLATAAIYARAFVAGLCGLDADEGVPVRIMGRLLTLDDWSAAFGAVDLPAGQSLFLSCEPGRITTDPPSDQGQATAALGFAAGPRTLAISMPNPILR